jgi:hypothetical protein
MNPESECTDKKCGLFGSSRVTISALLAATVLMGMAGVSFGAVPDTFVAVHCEPTHLGYYDALTAMVACADSFDARLTIEFNPQWADTILANPPLLAQVRAWQARGHEVAAHHHGISYGTGWDGFTDHPAEDILHTEMLRGGMDEYIALLRALAGDSLLLTGGVPDTADWPSSLPYRTEGHDLSEALTRPAVVSIHGRDVTGLGYGLLSNIQALDSAKILYASARRQDVLGIVLHEKNFNDDPRLLVQWFQFVRDRGGRVKTVTRILGERGYATAAPRVTAAPGRCRLAPNYPNPFNSGTVIRFELPSAGCVLLTVLDIRGRVVRTLSSGRRTQGPHSLLWDGTGDSGRALPSGVYLCRFEASGFSEIRRLALVR